MQRGMKQLVKAWLLQVGSSEPYNGRVGIIIPIQHMKKLQPPDKQAVF